MKKKKAGRDVKKKGGIENIIKGRQAGRQKKTGKTRTKKERKMDNETEVDERSNQGRR